MRYCQGETVQYFESMNPDAAVVLREAAAVIEENDASYHFTLTYCPDPDTGEFNYMGVLLVHG